MTILSNVSKPGGLNGSANFASSKDTGRPCRGNRGNRAGKRRSGQNTGHGQPYNLNNFQRGGRTRGNGRARGRGGYRGNNFNPHHDAAYEGKSNSRGEDSHVKLFCKFCQDDGHDDTSCHRYKRFANEAREEVKSNKAARSNSYIAHEYSGSAYPGLPTKAVKSYIAIETALISRKLDTYCKVDSGASQHFSGNKNVTDRLGLSQVVSIS
ncbi:hypothetical protein K3495_g6249 [Podosphaera aphanis]|nr:hypothetical protein K3495_g6249 [Podosphaera aphanis]